jgi:RhoGAP domain
MSVEGVFRKNGNIRRLKELSEIIDRDPSEAMLADENPIQVAALLKKFLREMPEPLLTFKLHRLIIFSQSKFISGFYQMGLIPLTQTNLVLELESEAERKRVLHLALCMMPKVNRDTVEVLLHFLRWTATFAHVDGKMGSMMDLTNLATVIAPNVLYSKSKDPAKDESFMAISAFEMMLKHEDSFCFVPDDIAQLLYDPMLLEDTANMTSKDFMRKLEATMKGRKQQEINEFAATDASLANRSQHDPYAQNRPPPEYPLYPRQHRYEPEPPANSNQLGLLSPLPYRSHSLSRQRDPVPHSQSPSSLRTQVNLPTLVNDNRLSHPSPSATTSGGLRS